MTENSMSLTVFDPIKATLAKLEEQDKSLVFDHTTPEGEKDLRSWVKRIRGYKGDVARAHKETKADALTFGRQVDAIKNELTAGADRIITERMKPLDEIEAKKRADAEAIIEAERVEKERIEAEEKAELERREAEVARKEAEIRESERVAREKQIAAEAAESARKEVEAKAEREKQEAVEAEKEKARKIEAERLAKIEAEKVEKERLAKIEAERVANVAHREKIEDETQNAIWGTLNSLRPRTIDGPSNVDLADAILAGIIERKIPHVTISY